jgi:hypothetical protein
VRSFKAKGDNAITNVFREVESASLLIRQKMFDRLVELKNEKDLQNVYLKSDLAAKVTKCLDGNIQNTYK